MRSITIILCLLIASITTSLPQAAVAQGSAGVGAEIQPRYIIDMPTAGLLPRGSYSVDLDFFQNGGVTLRMNAGIMHSLSFGISYGANRVVGSDKIKTNPLPGVNVRLRIMDETTVAPAVLLGFDSQGREEYLSELERFTIKSPGFFLAASKNYTFLGYLGIHGGINYSLENKDGADGINLYTGLEKSLGSDISILLEYNFGLNDDREGTIAKGRGYLNAGLKWSFGKGFTLGVDLKDILKNQEQISIGNRTVNIEFVSFF